MGTRLTVVSSLRRKTTTVNMHFDMQHLGFNGSCFVGSVPIILGEGAPAQRLFLPCLIPAWRCGRMQQDGYFAQVVVADFLSVTPHEGYPRGGYLFLYYYFFTAQDRSLGGSGYEDGALGGDRDLKGWHPLSGYSTYVPFTIP